MAFHCIARGHTRWALILLPSAQRFKPPNTSEINSYVLHNFALSTNTQMIICRRQRHMLTSISDVRCTLFAVIFLQRGLPAIAGLLVLSSLRLLKQLLAQVYFTEFEANWPSMIQVINLSRRCLHNVNSSIRMLHMFITNSRKLKRFRYCLKHLNETSYIHTKYEKAGPTV